MKAADQTRTFEEWLKVHKGLLFKVVRAYAFTSHDRDDLLQEIAVQVWKSVPGFKGQSAVTTWLYRVAIRTALDWSHKENRRQSKQGSLQSSEHLLTTVSESGDKRLDWLYDQIARLDEVDRSLTLLWLDGFDYRDIASTIGISESNVGVKLHRIRKYLATCSVEENE